MRRLTGKVILITGSTSGIGADAARRCAGEGASVIVSGRNAERGNAVAAECGDNAIFLALDITGEESWKNGIASIVEGYGRLDVLVNNAACMQPGTIETTSLEALDQIFAANVRGLVIGCQQAIAVMKEQNTPSSIVNILSTVAVKTLSTTLAYGGSKAAGLNMTKSIALHCAEQRYPIRCNAILPGGVATPMFNANLAAAPDREEALQAIIASHPIGRLLEGPEIASGVVYLASDESSGVTGAHFAVDGGQTAT